MEAKKPVGKGRVASDTPSYESNMNACSANKIISFACNILYMSIFPLFGRGEEILCAGILVAGYWY